MKPYMVPLKAVQEEDGRLVAINSFSELPFEPKRIFFIKEVPPNTTRGEHANRNTEYIFGVVNGTVKLQIESLDGEVLTYHLTDDAKGIYVPKNWWLKLFDFESDGIAMVLASTEFAESLYVEHYDEWKNC